MPVPVRPPKQATACLSHALAYSGDSAIGIGPILMARKATRPAKQKHTGLAVVESKWWAGKNTSVAPIFDLISDVFLANPNHYHYEMVSGKAAAKEAIPRIAADPACPVLYIAAHGEPDGIAWHNGEKLSRLEFRALLKAIRATRGAQLAGVYFASCRFLTQDTADFLFQDAICPWWIAGYSEQVDWLDSTALDMLFFRSLMSQRKGTDLARIKAVASDLDGRCAGLIRELGFGIYVRKSGTGGAKNLLSR